jgi:hypothetical protein
MLVVLLLAALCVAPAGARRPNLAKYPLRIHVLASDETHRSERMSPGASAVCDSIDDILGAAGPGVAGPISLSGMGGGDPCSLHPEMVTGRLLNVQDYDPVFSGGGRADLVSPPAGTQGISFQYDNCSRVRVPIGFQSLPARWKKPGKRLEVLIPSDEIPENGKPLRPVRCSFTVTVHDFVYLLLRNGKVVEVSQEDYWKKPALRALLSGSTQAIQQRPKQFTVPAHPTPVTQNPWH